jgi:hypothetical protein
VPVHKTCRSLKCKESPAQLSPTEVRNGSADLPVAFKTDSDENMLEAPVAPEGPHRWLKHGMCAGRCYIGVQSRPLTLPEVQTFKEG